MAEEEIILNDENKNEETKWPPSEDQIRNLAIAGLNKSHDKDVKILVYWENDPNLMIFNPIHYAKTEYVSKKFECNERSIEVHVGRVD